MFELVLSILAQLYIRMVIGSVFSLLCSEAGAFLPESDTMMTHKALLRSETLLTLNYKFEGVLSGPH